MVSEKKYSEGFVCLPIKLSFIFYSTYFMGKKKFVFFLLFSLQTTLGVSSLEEVINPKQVIPQYIMYNMTNTSKRGVVILQDKSGWYQ